MPGLSFCDDVCSPPLFYQDAEKKNECHWIERRLSAKKIVLSDIWKSDIVKKLAERGGGISCIPPTSRCFKSESGIGLSVV